jgi:hypothetical protein
MIAKRLRRRERLITGKRGNSVLEQIHENPFEKRLEIR